MRETEVNDILSHLSYDMKNADTRFEYEYATVNTHKERQLKDISTDKLIELLFSDSRNNDEQNDNRGRNRLNFLAYVYTSLNLRLKFELPQMLLIENIDLKEDEDVYFLFKGGSMMFYKYEELKNEMDNTVKDGLKRMFDEFFKVSDFDFTVYITVRQRNTFYKVKKLVNEILWKGLLEIRDFFETYLNSVNINEAVSNETLVNNIVGDITGDSTNIFNACMTIFETNQDIEALTINTLRDYVNLLKQLIYMKKTILSRQSKLSPIYHTKFNNKIQKYSDIVKRAYSIMFIYLNHKRYHITKLMYIHEFLSITRNNFNLLNISLEEQNEITLHLTNLRQNIQLLISNFTKHMQKKIIMDNFYTMNFLTTLQSNITEDLKKKDITLCRSVYDEFDAFGNDTQEMKTEENYTMIPFTTGNKNDIKVNLDKREDFYIQPDLLSENTMYTDTTKNNFHYMYQNSIIKKMRNTYSSVVDFDLMRVKLNLLLTFKDSSNNDKKLNIPAEFIDISICGYDDTSLTQFRSHPHDALGEFTLPSANYTLQCLGYSVPFMIHDLTYVLFAHNLLTPWSDIKYEKRIYRLSCLEMLLAHKNNTLPEYIAGLQFVYALLSKCKIFSLDIQNQTFKKPEIFDKLYQLTENVRHNYKKYDFGRITFVMPGMLIEPVKKDMARMGLQNNMIGLTTPFADELVGSIVFYTIIKYISKIVGPEDTLNILNRYRKEYMYFPLLIKDFHDTVQKSSDYLDKIYEIVGKMSTLVSKNGGSQKRNSKQQKAKINKFEFF